MTMNSNFNFNSAAANSLLMPSMDAFLKVKKDAEAAKLGININNLFFCQLIY